MDLASLEIRMSRSENLPALPQAAGKVLKLADDPDASPREIEKAIEMDPAITAKILRVANSAYYGATQIPNLGRAISYLGLTTVRSVIVSIAMQQMISGKNLCPSFDKLSYWSHSLAVGTAARILGKLKAPGKAEELYCAGMMHEIGLLAMDKFVPQELHAAILKSRESRIPLEEAELLVLGFTHADVGAVLAKKWGLSPLMIEAIQNIGNPFQQSEHDATTMIIALAEVIANKAGFTHSGVPAPDQIDPMLASIVGLPEEQFGIILDVVNQEVRKALDSFQVAA